ncbi:MAG: FG-GAP repeat protein, partial [Planctomycetaceae bacterium]|nr:FG-GAP repeat protein [Planctomycetaceae bacterium]
AGDGIAVHSAATGTGFVFYSEAPLSERFPAGAAPALPGDENNTHADHFFVARYDVERRQWFYSTGTEFLYFTPQENDLLVASIDFGDKSLSATSVTMLTGSQGEFGGVTVGYASGQGPEDTAPEFDIAVAESGDRLIVTGTRFSELPVADLPVTFTFNAPFAGQTRPVYNDPDRDVIHGGDGNDIIIGNQDLDRIFGDSGTDTIVASAFEVHDAEDLAKAIPPATSETGPKESRNIDPLVEIPDPALRLAIGKAIYARTVFPVLNASDIRVQPSARFRSSDLAEITSLDLGSTTVSNLTGLEFLTNLRSLNLAHTQVSDLTPLTPARFDGKNFPDADNDPKTRSTNEQASIDLVGTNAGVAGLQHLTIDDTSVYDMRPVRELQDLRFLSLDNATPMSFDLSVLASAPTGDANLGFVVNGIGVDDRTGVSVSSAGDVNNDGVDDFIVGAYNSSETERTYSGKSYVVYGRASDDPAFSSRLDLDNLGAAGITIIGAAAGDENGRRVSSAGDIDNDGIDDLIVTSWKADNQTGKTYIIYGSESLPATVDLANISNEVSVTTIHGVTDGRSGVSVSDLGDVDGDQIDDIIIGAYFSDVSGKPDIGKSYVIFGGQSRPPSIDLAKIGTNGTNGTKGIIITGAAANDQSGYSVSGTGDVNGDGLNDMFVFAVGGATANSTTGGKSYVIYGSRSLQDVNLASLGTAGITITGMDSYLLSSDAISDAGDLNGDGYSDLILGSPGADGLGSQANAGLTHVIFGGPSLPKTIDLAEVGKTISGITIIGAAPGDKSGAAVSGAGDFNADGYDDLIIGAYEAGRDGVAFSGAAFLIFGGPSMPSTIDLANLGTSGITITGTTQDELTGYSVSV